MAPKSRVAVRKRIADRLSLLRRDNVKRHVMVTEKNKLKTDRYNAQKVRQSQIEYDQLMSSASRGTGLDKLRGERMQHLSKLIGQYK